MASSVGRRNRRQSKGRQHPADRDRLVGTLLIGCVAVLLAGLFWYSEQPAKPSAATTHIAALDALVAEVCSARDHAGRGDLDAARSTFGDAHEGLHDLVREIGQVDEDEAERMRAADGQVEGDLRTNQPGAPTSLERLIVAARAAVNAINVGIDSSCP